MTKEERDNFLDLIVRKQDEILTRLDRLDAYLSAGRALTVPAHKKQSSLEELAERKAEKYFQRLYQKNDDAHE